jgi:Ataxin-3
MDLDPGQGHWFNLNSFLPVPEWVGKLYLGMVLQQAEADSKHSPSEILPGRPTTFPSGYSVFAVTQLDPDMPLALTRTEADEVAATLPEPTGRSTAAFNPQSFRSVKQLHAPSATAAGSDDMNLEDEDYELQAALHASLMGEDADLGSFDAPSASRPPPAIPPLNFGSSSREQDQLSPLDLPVRGFDNDADPVAASMARSRAMLDQMRREQEHAQRELFSDPDSEAWRGQRQREREEEDEMLRRAIAESEAMAKSADPQQEGREDDAMITTDEDDDPDYVPSSRQTPATTSFDPSNHRVYDDDDAELQAALKASLESAPTGWTAPEFTSPVPVQPPSAPMPPAAVPVPPGHQIEEDVDSDDEVEDVEVPSSDPVHASPAKIVDVDEMRRKRLARFGG